MEFLECGDDEWQETEIETEQGTFGFDTASPMIESYVSLFISI